MTYIIYGVKLNLDSWDSFTGYLEDFEEQLEAGVTYITTGPIENQHDYIGVVLAEVDSSQGSVSFDPTQWDLVKAESTLQPTLDRLQRNGFSFLDTPSLKLVIDG